MNIARKRKLDARALRLGNVLPVESTVKVPQPKNLNVKETVKVENKSPKVTEAKRGRGRPKKVASENIVKSTKTKQVLGSNKKQGKIKSKEKK